MPTPSTNREALPATLINEINALILSHPGVYPEIENWLEAQPSITPDTALFIPPVVIGWMNQTLLNPSTSITESQAKTLGNAIYQLCGVTPPPSAVADGPASATPIDGGAA